jgi:N-methylhydantoinase A
MRYSLAADVGGTFTDVALMDVEGRVFSAKAPTTKGDPSEGLIAALNNASQVVGLDLRGLLEVTDRLHLASTAATNALLTHVGPKAGHLTTVGMEDNLGIGRLRLKSAGLHRRAKLEPGQLQKPVPIVPRRLVRGITERIDYRGRILVALDQDAARIAIDELARAGVEAISVCLLWSPRNPTHEQELARIIEQEHPEIDVSLSSEVCPLVGEYERAATVVIDSFVRRLSASHLTALERSLREQGFEGTLRLMQAGGGLMPLEAALRRPVLMLNSGPVGGVIGAAAMGARLGHDRIITADVGGTSFDVSIIRDGQPTFANQPIVGRHFVFVPMLDVRSIGSGGGSIARVEAGSGRLEVGPGSAGADPGPACYARGGELPTLTDADVVLGRIDPEYFLGGAMRLDRERAMEAVEQHVAKPLRMSVIEAAAGIVRIADSDMTSLARNMTIGEGHDPKHFMVYAYGGLSGIHATSFARELGARGVLAPFTAGIFSAFGICSSDCLQIAEESVLWMPPWEVGPIVSVFDRLKQDVEQRLEADGATPDLMSIECSVDLRYRGQVHEVRVPLGALRQGVEEAIEGLGDAYRDEYVRLYGEGSALEGWPIEAIACRVVGRFDPHGQELARHLRAGEGSAKAQKGSRDVYFEELGGFAATPIYDRLRLQTGHRIPGPAVVESPDTAVLLRPGQSAEVDLLLGLAIDL